MAVQSPANQQGHGHNGTVVYHASSPPSLPRLRSVPLPPMLPAEAPAPVLHPILQMGAVPLSLVWNVRRPLFSTESPPWMTQPATYPTLDSMTIRISSGLAWNRRESDRPIVVFPDNEDRGIVTIRDVLERVHVAFTRQRPGSAGASLTVPRMRPIVWAGLTPSESERDVWVLLIHIV